MKRDEEEFPPENFFCDAAIILLQAAAIQNLPQLQERMLFKC